MDMVDTCRVCLCGQRRLHAISNTLFQEMWEKLTNAKFNSCDGKSLLVCYLCCAQLRRSHQLMKRALEADKLLTAIVNSPKQSQNALLLLASQSFVFDYKYTIEHLHPLDYKQFVRNTVEEIKKENEEDSEEWRVMNIKEEEGGASARKRTLNAVHQHDAKRVKLDETTIDYRSPLTNTDLKIMPTSFSKKSSVDSNVKNSKNKLNTKSVANCHQGNGISPKVNTVPKHKIQVKNVVAQNSETSPSKVVGNNAETETFKPCLPKNVDAVPLNSHLHKDTGEKPYECDLCDYRISRKGNLEIHIKHKHTREKNFSCHMCEYKCVTKSELIRHSRKHTGEKRYKCDLCDYRFSERNTLETHIKFKHTKEKNFSCHMCQYKCVTKSDLIKHSRKHTGEKPYECDLCDYRCSRKGTLESHVKYKHTKEKNFSCHMCEYKCVTKSGLITHSRKHTGEKPYKCDLCDYRCLRKSDLISHIKYKHTKEKDFSCHMCQYKCVTKRALSIHLCEHTGKKPYQCDLCDYRCSFKNSLNLHILSKHTQ